MNITAGSIINSNGRTKYSLATSPALISLCLISLSLLRFSFPVNVLNLCARFSKIVSGSVSGRKNERKMALKPEIHASSQSGQRHPFAAAANPPMMGPRTGPATAARAQRPRAKGTDACGKISPTLAPPVANAGLPRKPAMKRRTRRPPMFVDSAVGIWMIAKSARVMM